jgi:hypothetical protein
MKMNCCVYTHTFSLTHTLTLIALNVGKSHRNAMLCHPARLKRLVFPADKVLDMSSLPCPANSQKAVHKLYKQSQHIRMHACNKHRPSASNARTEGARTWRSPSSLLLLLSAPLLSSALVQSNLSALRLTPVEAALATASNSGTVRRVTIALPVAAPAPAPAPALAPAPAPTAPTPLPPPPRLHTRQGECQPKK